MDRTGGGLNEAFSAYCQDRSPAALERLIAAGRGFVEHFARLYAPNRTDDVVQSGYEGLLKAIDRYDPDRGVAFSTYAGHCVLGEIRHWIRSEASYYRPGPLADLQRKVDRFITDELQRTGEAPPLSRIADHLNVTPDGVAEAMQAGLVSLDELDQSKIHSQRYRTFRLPIEDRIMLEQGIERLNVLQRKVVWCLFYRDMTQEQAARELGMSQRQVSRVLKRSLSDMADMLA